MCKDIKIAKSIIVEKFLRALGNEQFANILEESGLKEINMEDWAEFILQRVNEWNSFQRNFQLYGQSGYIDSKQNYKENKGKYKNSKDVNTKENSSKVPIHHKNKSKDCFKCYGCGHLTTSPHRK